MNLHTFLKNTKLFSHLDTHFAAYLHQLDGSPRADLTGMAAALLSRQQGAGHSCVSVERFADFLRSTKAADHLCLGEEEQWPAILAASPAVSDGSEPLPLVLDRERLYLFRYFQAEVTIARGLGERLASRQRLEPDRQFLAALFPPTADEVDWQAKAALAALQSPICVVTGGPGTGKTSTVVKILALLAKAAPDLSMAMAAPTGKAAARLSDSIASQKESLRLPAEVGRRIPEQVATVHRLLGSHGPAGRFRFNAENPLPFQVIVVDEVSMVDLLLMEALVCALPKGARLILLGDRNQLASVETGHVLADICDGAGATALREAVVELRKNYRFGSGAAIASVAEAVRQGQVAKVTELLDDPASQGLHRVQTRKSTDSLLASVLPLYRKVGRAASAQEGLDLFARARILCATRHGPHGVDGLTDAVERDLAGHGLDISSQAYQGRPVMITRNDYQTGLFNGDIGICWPDEEGLTLVYFPTMDQEGRPGLRGLPLARLPEHCTAWAMTIHKSQGSEFERVLLFLGEPGPVVSRQLLYTGITRAREEVYLVASPEVLELAIATSLRRDSGLLSRLQELSNK